MSDAQDSRPASNPGATAGALLRQARQARGLHIAALAVAIKVTQRKLELLESDRYDELPDATFTRALAQTVCRTLKIDSAPVLALLPQPKGYRLEHVGEGLNTPFRERPGRMEPKDWSGLASPAVWGPALVLLAAALVYMLPSGWLKMPQSRAASAPMGAASAASSVAAVADAPASAVETLFPPTDPAAGAVGQTKPFEPVSGILQVRASAQSWVEVQDGRGQTLVSRLIEPGEAVGLDGATPLKVRIGNAAVTQVVFRGKELELSSFTRDNIARLELK